MQSDNLENLFREKAEELQHTPPPQFNWSPEKSWEKLQPMLPVKQRRLNRGFYMGIAAGLILALVAGLFLYRLPSDLKAPALNAPVAAVQKRTAVETGVATSEQTESTAEKEQTSLAKTEAYVASTSRNRKEKSPGKILPVKSAAPEKIILSTQEEQKGESVPDQKYMAATELSVESCQSIKITVVLGAKTLARSEKLAMASLPPSDSAGNKKKSKKEKLRLRIHNVDADFSTDKQLATNKSIRPGNGLGTRIKF